MTLAQGMGTNHWTARGSFTPQRRREDLVVELLDGEAILYDPAEEHTHRLSQSALDVWQQCDGRRETVDMAKRLTATYDVDFETALDHVEQLVARFTESGLLDPEDD